MSCGVDLRRWPPTWYGQARDITNAVCRLSVGEGERTFSLLESIGVYLYIYLHTVPFYIVRDVEDRVRNDRYHQ